MLQCIFLLIIVAAICIGGRIASKNIFETDLILFYGDEKEELSDLRIVWENGEENLPEGETAPAENGMSVRNMEIRQTREDDVRATTMHLSLQPEEPGDYYMTVYDRKGEALIVNPIHVGRFGTAVSMTTGAFTGDEAVLAAALVFYIGIVFISLLHFIRLKGPLAASYDAILSAGVFIFSFVALMIQIPVYVRHLTMPAFYPTWQLLADIASGGRYFVVLTFPLVIIFSVLLIISNIALLRHERPRIQNVLGLLLGFMMIAADFSYMRLFSLSYAGSYEQVRLLTTVENVLGIVITYAECVQISAMICGLRSARHVPAYDRDYILILGCGFRKDGTLPPLLRGRVDKAVEFWKRQKQATGKEAILIPSGGQGRDECMAEAEAMYRYLVGTGFPEKAIIKENQSANTFQNMEFSKNIIEAREGKKPVKTAYVTTNYHVFRSGVWAGLAGLSAEGLGSRTKWWFWPNAFVRECIGLLKNRIISEMILLVIVTVLFGAISYFAF